MKKDVLFLCQFFYPEHNSSATLPFDTAKYLAAHGLQVDALCGYPREYSDAGEVPLRETKDGVGIRRIRYIQLARGKKLSRLINYFSFTVSALMRLFRIRCYKSVIVYSNPPVLPVVAVLANMLFRTKIIFVAYDLYPEIAYASGTLRPGDMIDRGMRWINIRMYKRVSAVVAMTDEMREFIVQNRPVDPQKVVTIANWAHEKRRDPDQAAFDRFGYTKDQFVVSYFGNMGICQDMQTLMGAAEQLKEELDIRFLIVGHGSKKEQIRQQIQDKNLKNVQLLDFLTGKEFEQAVAVSSCCVVSLKSGIKGMCAPSKLYSYLQGGKPVLAVAEKGSYLHAEVEGRKIGRAVTLGDVSGLCDAILQTAENRKLCAQMGEHALRLYEEEYAMQIGLGKYQVLLENLL